jgi:hypothetical protein
VAPVPLDYFGQGNVVVDCNQEHTLHVQITNGDGRTASRDYVYFPCPNSQVLGASMDKLAYFQSSGSALLTVNGYALRSDYQLTVNVTDDASNSHFTEHLSLDAAGFPNTVTQQIDLGALPVPTSPLGSSVVIELKTLNATGAAAQDGNIIAGFTLFK